MKKIYAIVLSAIMLLSGIQANAQLSVGAGYLNSKETGVSSDDHKPLQGSNDLNGFYVGVNYNIPIIAGLGIAPGIYGSAYFLKKTSGPDTKLNVADLKSTRTYREFDINVPVNVNYMYNISRDLNLFAYAGPVFQVGLSGKMSTHYEEEHPAFLDEESDVDVYAGEAISTRNRFNIYLGGGIGMQVAGIQVILGYDHSLLPCNKVTEKYTVGRSQIKIGVGYSF